MNWFERLQAVTSISRCHAASCRCPVCRAAGGDERAMAAIIKAIVELDLADQAATAQAGVR